MEEVIEYLTKRRNELQRISVSLAGFDPQDWGSEEFTYRKEQFDKAINILKKGVENEKVSNDNFVTCDGKCSFVISD